MPPKEKAVVIVLGTAILGAIAYLVLYAPIGSLGSADGQSYDVDRFSLIGYLLFLLAVGYFVVRSHHRQQVKTEFRKWNQAKQFGLRLQQKNPALEVPVYFCVKVSPTLKKCKRKRYNLKIPFFQEGIQHD